MSKKKNPNFVDTALNQLLFWGRNPKGEVGIEVEVEGGPWPEGAITNWEAHVDNSLRNGGIEYVIRQPVARERVRAALQTLEKALANHNKVFSYRTSIHVHINIQDLTLREWCSFVTLFTTLEELLVDVVGPTRKGNKFCLRMKDADQPLTLIQDALRHQNLNHMFLDDIKYASMNIQATRSHGTLEFRAMEGNLDVTRISDWVTTLLALKDYARNLESPRDVPEQLSRFGPQEFVRRVLPDNALRAQVLRNPELVESIYEGVRLAQDVAYGTEWGEKSKTPVAPPKPEAEVHAGEFNEIFDDFDGRPVAAPMPRFREPPRLNARMEQLIAEEQARLAARRQGPNPFRFRVNNPPQPPAGWN